MASNWSQGNLVELEKKVKQFLEKGAIGDSFLDMKLNFLMLAVGFEPITPSHSVLATDPG